MNIQIKDLSSSPDRTFDQLECYQNIRDAIAAQSDDNPLYLFRPEAIAKQCNAFSNHFSGRVIYAVKANHNPRVIQFLSKQGIDAFDVASINEIQLVHTIAPDAEIFFMNPVKYPSSIRQAYFQFGVRNFVLDSTWELDKILNETNHANDLHLFVRVSVSNQDSMIELSNKFGIPFQQAPELLEQVHQHTDKVSLAFHVGSQCTDSTAYHQAFTHINDLLSNISFSLTSLDIGGGFPANYKKSQNDPLVDYLQNIQMSYDSLFPNSLSLSAEPGRAMVADSCSLVVKVIGRKNNSLYLTDGIYGGLAENENEGIQFPVRTFSLNSDKAWSKDKVDFTILGPSCDGYDSFESQFQLPKNIQIGDYIEFGNAGAYSEVFRTNFNGFYPFNQACINDDPF